MDIEGKETKNNNENQMILSFIDALSSPEDQTELLTQIIGTTFRLSTVFLIPRPEISHRIKPKVWSTDHSFDPHFLFELPLRLSLEGLGTIQELQTPYGVFHYLPCIRQQSLHLPTSQINKNQHTGALFVSEWNYSLRTLREIGEITSEYITNRYPRNVSNTSYSLAERLLGHSEGLYFSSNAHHRVTYINRKSIDFFGVPPEEVLLAGSWIDFLHPEDKEEVIKTISLKHSQKNSTTERIEFFCRTINRVTTKVRWLHLTLHPFYEGDEISGWDAVGFDGTSLKDAQLALDVQTKKIRALYTVSSAIRGIHDPSSIASRGLVALLDASKGQSGICFLFPQTEKSHNNSTEDEMLLLAEHNLEYTNSSHDTLIAEFRALASLVTYRNQAIVIPDALNDTRVSSTLHEVSGIRSLIFVPLIVEQKILGVLGVFSQLANQFDGGSVMFLSSAANQLGLAAQQAQLLKQFEEQAKNLSALYRMSH